MKQEDDKSEVHIDDKEQEVLQELFDALDRTLDARIKDCSEEEAKYIELYGKNISHYLLSGVIYNDILYFNCAPEGINGPYKHFSKPLRCIDLKEVNKYFNENSKSPDEKDWEDFEQSIDEDAEKFEQIYKNEELRFLSYFRYESGEYCYYDIIEGKLVETGLIYELSFRDEDSEVCSASEDYLIKTMNKGTNGLIFDIVYNPEADKYGLIMGYDIVYDIDWLKDYTDYRLENRTERVGKLIYRYNRKEISEKELLSLGVNKLDSMLRFIRDTVDGDIKAPKGLLDEMFDEYMYLFDYVTDIVKK